MRRLCVLVAVIPFLLAATWSCYPAMQALLACYKFKAAETYPGLKESKLARIELQREIQGHFRPFAVHIPTSDILFRPIPSEADPDSVLQLARTCGHGNVYVWVPLIFRFPLIGNKAIEWCWIPQV